MGIKYIVTCKLHRLELKGNNRNFIPAIIIA